MLVFLSTQCVLCQLCYEAVTMYEQDKSIRLALISKKIIVLNVRVHVVKALIAIMPKLDASYEYCDIDAI